VLVITQLQREMIAGAVLALLVTGCCIEHIRFDKRHIGCRKLEEPDGAWFLATAAGAVLLFVVISARYVR